MIANTQFTIRAKILEKTDKYIVADLLASNKFWDETDIAFDHIKLERSPHDLEHEVGEIIIATINNGRWDETQPPLIIEKQLSTSGQDYGIYSVANMKSNSMSIALDYKWVIVALLIFFLGAALTPFIKSIKKTLLTNTKKN